MSEARKGVRTGSATRILAVEDEPDLAYLLAYNLEAEGYVVESVRHGDEADLRLREDPPDLVILDWMLPGMSGIEICRRLRSRETTRTLPVIMVTGRGEERERVRGLSVGADGYVVKPFSVPELMARVRALLRRSRPERIAERLNAGDLELDRVTQRVRRGDRDIRLAPMEFRLLEFMLEKPGRVFSRAQLLDAVWGQAAEIDERTVDVYVGRLRKALSKKREPDLIRIVHGAGYSFDETLGTPSFLQSPLDFPRETAEQKLVTRRRRHKVRGAVSAWAGPPWQRSSRSRPIREIGGSGPAKAHKREYQLPARAC